MQEHFEPLEPITYRTGSTKPPKKSGCLFAFLLMLAIFSLGIFSCLGLFNIQLWRNIDVSDPNETVSIVVSSQPEEEIEENQAAKTSEDPHIGIGESNISYENIPQEGSLSLQDIYEKVIDSVVSISCSLPGGSSTGSGVILSEEGFVVTNAHVVEDATQIQVLLTDGRNLEATLIGADKISDLAVLEIEADNLVAAQLGDSSVLRVGDVVVAIGDPLGVALRGTMTDGIVSAINRDVTVDGRVMNLIQTNAALNSGNSGGPLLNCYGQVIGINTMKIGDTVSAAGVEGLGFAIPSTTVSHIVNQLLQQGYVSGRPAMGISGEQVSLIYQMYYRLPSGLQITYVEPGGSADLAGIQTGDILLRFGNVRITTLEDLESALYTCSPGDTVQLIIFREGKQYSVSVTLGEAHS
jgi:serine protease Do